MFISMEDSIKINELRNTPEGKKEANTDMREEFGKEIENLEQNQSEILSVKSNKQGDCGVVIESHQ